MKRKICTNKYNAHMRDLIKKSTINNPNIVCESESMTNNKKRKKVIDAHSIWLQQE